MWIFFVDKPDGRGGRVAWGDAPGSHGPVEQSLELDPEYVAGTASLGVQLRYRSRWLNGVSGTANEAQIARLREEPFVRSVRQVLVHRRPPPSPVESHPASAPKQAALGDYGFSYDQLAQIGVIALHGLGYDGEGIRIALLDNGYHYEHPALAGAHIVAERDFVNGDDVVSDESVQPVTGDETRSEQNIHGAQVLSVMAGYDAGRFVGVAPGATYILAKTEDNRVELPIEEDRWVAGLEWADSLGADIVNSSVGYNLWDDGTGYSPDQLDGGTAVSTIAAQVAVERGVLVVAAAGNEGGGAWRYVTVPADARGVISVGSVDIPTTPGRLPTLSPSSSRGRGDLPYLKPDVVAPGQGAVVADIRGGGYVHTSGTSFASPMVAGICALLLQADGGLRPEQIQERLHLTATDLGEAGPDTAYGWGQVDALKASGLQPELPADAVAGAPFPNPASGGLVHFPLLSGGSDEVQLRVFDLSGALIAADRLSPAGYTDAGWIMQWQIPTGLADGVYLYRLRTASLSRAGKIALVRRVTD